MFMFRSWYLDGMKYSFIDEESLQYPYVFALTEILEKPHHTCFKGFFCTCFWYILELKYLHDILKFCCVWKLLNQSCFL